MAHNGEPRRRLSARAELGRFLGLLGATAVAISQPLLEIFGKSPATFVFRSARGRDLVVFGFAVVLLPPAVLWLAGFTVGLVTPRWRAGAHAVCVGVLFALLLVQIVSPAPDSTHEIDAAAGFAEMLADTYPAMRPGDDPVAALYALSSRHVLYGAAHVPATTDTSSAPRVDDIHRLRSELAPVLALSGELDDELTAVTHVVAGLDGRVVGISPIVERKDSNAGFVLLLPAAAPADVDSVRLGLVRGNTVSTEIIDTGPPQG